MIVIIIDDGSLESAQIFVCTMIEYEWMIAAVAISSSKSSVTTAGAPFVYLLSFNYCCSDDGRRFQPIIVDVRTRKGLHACCCGCSFMLIMIAVAGGV